MFTPAKTKLFCILDGLISKSRKIASHSYQPMYFCVCSHCRP
jgi:hypothetical protein